MSRYPINPSTGELQDFEARPGDPTYAQVAGSQRGSRRQRWGNRVLLAVQPSNNPNLGGAIARNRATVVEVGDLGIVRPLALQVRFAVNGGGQPQLPFAPLTPPFASSDLIQLVWTVRRGIDPVADATRDTYLQPLSQPAGSIYGSIDRAPFDVIAARSLGIDVELRQTDATGLGPPTQPTITTNYWVEVIAFPITNEGNLQKLTAWQNNVGPGFRAASPTSIVLMPVHNARCQFIICNTSTNANLWVSFGAPAVITPTPQATFVLPSSPQFSVYESPVDGFRGIVYGIWDNATPNGGALVTEGERMSGQYP
jgi:hypothetical protein